jgi:predicted transcriptional regulator of viral defense system
MYIQFKSKFSDFPLISILEIQKAFPNFDRRRFVEWQQKGYIENIKRGFYRFKDRPIEEGSLFFTANKIYTPSYLSLETVLAYYGIIPEAVFAFTSVSTLNTTEFETILGNFSYRHVKPELFFGYQLIVKNKLTVSVAFPEKAILDFLYFHSEISSIEDFEAFRWNINILKGLNFNRMENYLQLFHNKQLNKRYELLKKYLYA